MVSWSELRDICAAEVECGAHSVTHEQLDTLPQPWAKAEIADSKHAIEDHLGRAVHTFSYPHGRYDSAVRAMVIEAGYTGACSTDRAVSNPADDRYALARIPIMNGTTAEQLGQFLAGENLDIAPVPQQLKTRVWRKVRRAARAIRGGRRYRIEAA
jgi:peptidoglycan/xylan/chitin deacetylase (PgdA/CDA1 family)